MTTPAAAPVLPAKSAWLAGDCIEPARAETVGVGCTIVVFVLYALGNVLPHAESEWAPLGIAIATAVALRVRAIFAVHAGVISLLHGLVYLVPWLGGVWPLDHLSVLVVYGLLVAVIRPLRESSGWLRRGRVDRGTRLAIAAFSGTSALALVVWRFASHVDMASYRSFVPSWALALPTGVLIVAAPIGIVLFAMQNAAFEEIIRRGVMMQALESAFGRGAFVCVLQAVGFGVWHYRGFPSGVLGSTLTFVFALMMGILRMRGRGMLAPWVAHVCADTAIFVMVFVIVISG